MSLKDSVGAAGWLPRPLKPLLEIRELMVDMVQKAFLSAEQTFRPDSAASTRVKLSAIEIGCSPRATPSTNHGLQACGVCVVCGSQGNGTLVATVLVEAVA